MAKVISIVNQKGGVGKTTTAVNLSGYLAMLNQKVLIVDLDPQGNASSGIGIDYRNLSKGLYEGLTGQAHHRDVIKTTNLDGLHALPSTPNLAGANVELVNLDRREWKLNNFLAQVADNYDYIIIDCPPSLGLLTVNGLVASDKVLIPVQCEYYALEGLGQLLHTINLVQNALKSELGILGAVITMYDPRNRLSDAVFKELYQYFPNKIFRSVIPRNVRLAEAPSYGKSILEYDSKSKGGRAYERLAKELLEMY